MGKIKQKVNFSEKAETEFSKTKKALTKAAANIIAETKAKNSYLVISDKKGNIKKIPAKDL